MTVSPEMAAALAVRAGPEGTGIAFDRARHRALTPLLSGPGAQVAEVRDEVADGVPLRVFVPREAGPGAVLYVHGGGWSVGEPEGFDPLCRALADASGATIALADYRLAPEHPFPAGLDDVRTALAWLLARCGPVAVAGDSAGGNLATVAARHVPGAVFQALVYPAVDATATADADPAGDFRRADIDEVWRRYLAGADPSHPDVSPLRSPTPLPAFILTAEVDPLRDEGEAYAAALRAAGVPVELRRYEGAVHGFFRWLAATTASRRAVGEVGAALRAALAA